MKRCKSLIALFLALTASGAKAQYFDSFSQGKLGPAWSFVVPGSGVYVNYGNAAGNSEDPSLYNISGGSLNITQQGAQFSYGRNVPSVTVAANAPGDYDIRFSVAEPVTTTSYIGAGLVIFKDNQNYLEFWAKHNGGNGTAYANTTLTVAGAQVGGYDNLVNYGDISAGPAQFHINKTGTTITFSVTPANGTEGVLGTVSASDTDAFKAAAYTFLKDLSGLHIGFSNDNYDNTVAATASFSGFSTSLPVVLPTTTDNFFGPKLNPTWAFPFPGSWSDTGYLFTSEDPGAYSVGNGAFVITAKNSGLYGATSYIRNVASATVAPAATGDYDIEIAADGAFNYPLASENNQYPDYGLILYTDASNCFTIGAKHSGYPSNGSTPNNYNYANTTLRIGNNNVGNYDNLATYGSIGYGPTLYRVKKTGTTITFSYTRPGDVETIMGTASASDTDPFKAGVYSFLSSMADKKIGMYANPGFDGNIVEPVAFSKFFTDLPLVNPITFDDELTAPKFSPAWSFNIPGGNPVNSEDPANYSLANGQFNVNVQRFGLNYTLNLPSVTVGTGKGSGDWWIETAITAPFTTLNTYPYAELAIFDDANNYAIVGLKNAGYAGAPGTQFVASGLNIAGTYTDDVINGPQVGGQTVIRIVKTGGAINFYSLTPGSYPNNFATLDNTATGAKLAYYNYLQNLDGKHIGFTTSTSGSGVTTDTASFDYLRTSLNILAPGAVTGSLSLEGVSDLSAISPNAPLGVFDVQFRAVGSTTPLYEFKSVALTTKVGSAFGTFSVAVPAGTYDVWIKGKKNLAVLTSGVVISAAGGTLAPVQLPAADANGDNSVDSSDFTALIGSFNSDATITGSGYDTTADFNFDGFVDSSDFTLLIGEFNNVGPI